MARTSRWLTLPLCMPRATPNPHGHVAGTLDVHHPGDHTSQGEVGEGVVSTSGYCTSVLKEIYTWKKSTLEKKKRKL